MLSFFKKPPLPVLMLIAVISVLAFLHLLSKIAERSARVPASPGVVAEAIALEAVSYAALPGWSLDDLSAAIPVFLRSCEAIWQADPASLMNTQENLPSDVRLSTVSGEVRDWLGPCAVAQRQFGDIDDITKAQARAFFEGFFRPFRVNHPETDKDGNTQMVERGLMTGYFEPIYEASLTPTTRFTTPVLQRPDDLIDIDLGQFRPSLNGINLSGRIEGRKLIPYEDHEAIIKRGATDDPLAFMDPDDLLFLQIQGSGKLRLDDRVLRIGYAAKNGRPYTAIGKVLIDRGEMTREELSMQALIKWLKSASPAKAAELRYHNQSYVFFKSLDSLSFPELGPVGAQGVQLTARRSLAVDRQFYAMGVPVFVALTEALADDTEKFRQLMIAQDTGGAIKGAVRGDIFTGSGEGAAKAAGSLKARGTFYVLLPKALAMRVGAEINEEIP